jgi:hypothetical protein
MQNALDQKSESLSSCGYKLAKPSPTNVHEALPVKSQELIQQENRRAIFTLCSTLILGSGLGIFFSRSMPMFDPVTMFAGWGLGFLITWAGCRLSRCRGKCPSTQ